jgi:hypothetical protein
MTAIQFSQSNHKFTPPAGMDETQVQTVHPHAGIVKTGPIEGETVVVTAWQPDARELALILAGRPILISFMGGLPPHYPCVDFTAAINPSVQLAEVICPHCGASDVKPTHGPESESVNCDNCAADYTLHRKT